MTVFNYGQFAETFNVTIYANTTAIATFANITLPSRNSTTVAFAWNTTDFTNGNYTLSAYAIAVLEETYTLDNTYTDGFVLAAITGDVNGDGHVSVFDLFDLARMYGLDSSNPNWNPNCDFNSDRKVDASDLSDLSGSYGTASQ